MEEKITEVQNEQQPVQAASESVSNSWLKRNERLLTIIFSIIIVGILGYMLVDKFIIKPNEIEASDRSLGAFFYFSQNDYQRALIGDERNDGFTEIADNYPMNKVGKLASLYSGICYFKLGQYEEAVKSLEKFNAKDINIYPASRQMIGDAYVQLGEYQEAIKYFEKAVSTGNEIVAPTSLKKMGLVYLEMDNKSAAKKAFERIKKEYITSPEAQDIDKFIALTE